MSSECSLKTEVPTEMIFVAQIEESSEEPPMEEWSSLIFELPETNVKKNLFQDELYYPGSGEICTKYITMSDSAVFRHVYYNYPPVSDPGIKNALLQPDVPLIYPDDGQELYLALCKDMGQCPIRIFHRGLLDSKIDLRYYSVNPNGVRCMSIALRYNRFVTTLDLTDNFLNLDACYHLGEMLMNNSVLVELILSGCQIGPEGARRILTGLPVNRSLKVLKLERNHLGDVSMEYLARAIFQGMDVHHLYLSYNNIGSKGANMLNEALETHNKIVGLDLSWNNLYSPATFNLITKLGENNVLQNLNLSWNSLYGDRIGNAIKNVMKAPNLRNLNLSNNRLSGNAISNLAGNMAKAKKLISLDLSYNPMTPKDAMVLLMKMKSSTVKLQKLIMENVFVDIDFLEELKKVKEMGTRKNFVLIYGGLAAKYKPVGPDVRELVLNRAEFLAKKSKKHSADIALIALQLLKDNNMTMNAKDFSTAVRAAGAPLDDDLLDEMVNIFAGPRTPKSKTIDIKMLVDYVKRKWPNRDLPPTPPAEPEPIMVIEPKRKEKGKGKKK